MKLNREKFVSVLEKIYPAIGDGNFVPDLAFFKIKDGRIQAYDGFTLIDTQLPESIGFDCAIPGEPFLKLLRSLSEDEIEVDKEDKEVKVKTDKLKGTFISLEEVDVKDAILGETITEDGEDILDLINGLLVCRIAVNKDQTSGPLQGVMIDGDKLISSDRYRIILRKLNKKYDELKCSIPVKFVDIISKCREEVEKINFANDRVVVILKDGTYIATLLLGGELPNLVTHFPKEGEFKEIEFSEKISTAIDRHVNFLSRIDLVDREINVKISGSICTLRSKDAQLGSLEEVVDIQNESNCEVEFKVNPSFLKDITGICSIMKYYPEKGMIILGKGKLQYLTMDRSDE